MPRAPAVGMSITTQAHGMLLPGPDPSYIFKLLYRAELSHGAVPTEGHLVTDSEGRPLLCLLCKASSLLLAYTLPW